MEHKEFCVGVVFYTGSGAWVCTDVGTRTITAVEQRLLEERPNGPPYEWAETVFDEYDHAGCSLSADMFEQMEPWRREDQRDQHLYDRVERFVALDRTTNPDRSPDHDRHAKNVTRAKAIAEANGLTFHIANGRLETHAGHKSEERAASEEELVLWRFVEMGFHRIG